MQIPNRRARVTTTGSGGGCVFGGQQRQRRRRGIPRGLPLRLAGRRARAARSRALGARACPQTLAAQKDATRSVLSVAAL